MRPTLLVLLMATPAWSFAPAHVVHEMAGRMLPAGRADVAVTLRLDCVFYEEGPSCRGSWRCKPLPHERQPDVCRHRHGRATLELSEPVAVGNRTDMDPSLAGHVHIVFADGASCRLDGRVPYLFGLDVPGMSGQYRCTDADGLETERGVFGFRTRSVGKPFRVFD